MDDGKAASRSIGWIGTGRMGYQLVERLLTAGCDVSVWNRTRAKAEPLAERGATVVDTPADLAGCSIVFTMVAGSDDLVAVTTGPDGVLGRADAAPDVIVDSSTVSAEASEAVRAAAAARGAALLAAPVSGNPKVVKAGKALYIGASAMYAWQLMKMLATSDRLGLARFIAMQNYYNVIYREEEREMLPLCRAEGIGVTPFSPLARGFVVGNRRKEDYGETVRAKTDEFSRRQYYRPEDFAIVDRVTELAKKRGANNAQIALAWVLHQPGITAPIIGASKQGHLEDAVKALAVKLDAEELKYLSELYKPRGVLANV